MNPDVVVCGAGVGGLAAACSLGALGLRVLLVDKQRYPRPVAKGEVLQPASLRILRSWGAERQLRELGAVYLSRLVVRDRHGEPMMSLDYGRLPAGDQRLLAHDYTTILAALAGSLGPTVEVRRGVLVEGLLRGHDGRVTGVRASEEGRQYEIRAGLVVAADGISSRLRRAAGLDARRVDYGHRLLCFDVPGAPDLTGDFSAYVTGRGLHLLYPLPGDRVRLYAQVGPDELRGTGSAASAVFAAWCEQRLAEVPALEPLTGPLLANLGRRQLLPVSRFLAPRLGVPGLVMVGESAHAVHPMAAQGMNSAITDAACLAAHVSASVAAAGAGLAEAAEAVDAALRAYADERMPRLTHIARVSHNAARMITDTSRWGRAFGRRAVRHTGTNPRLLYKVTYNMSGLGMRPMTPLDRLYQFGLLPDLRAHQVPAWV